DDAEQPSERVKLIDQRRMLRLRLLDRFARSIREVERDRDDLEPLWVELFTQFLPDRQIESAPSPAGPREQENLLPAKARKRKGLPAPVGQREVGRLRGRQGVRSDRLRA